MRWQSLFGRRTVGVLTVVVAAVVFVVVRSGRDATPDGSPAATRGAATPDPRATPSDAATLARICDSGAGFGGAPAYRGAGPHPTVVLNGWNVTWGRDTSAASMPREPVRLGTVQLAACLRPGGAASPSPLATCQYNGGISVTLLQGRHQLDVHAVDSGRLVQTITVDGSTEPTCPPSVMIVRGTPSTSEVTDPGDAEYTAALARLVDGPAIG